MKLRRFAVVAMCMAMAFALAGCSGGPTPTEVTKGALDALKAQDAETLQSYYAGDSDELESDLISGGFIGGGSEDASNETEEQKATREKILAVLSDFDYELGDENIDGDKATVEVTITSHDMATVFTAAIEDYFAQAFGMALNGASQEEMSDLFTQIFVTKLDPEAEKTHVATTTFNLTKVDGTWKLDKLSDDNVDALFGGILTTINSMNEALNGTADKAS